MSARKMPPVGSRIVHELPHLSRERHGEVLYHLRSSFCYQPDDGEVTMLCEADEPWKYEPGHGR